MSGPPYSTCRDDLDRCGVSDMAAQSTIKGGDDGAVAYGQGQTALRIRQLIARAKA